MHALDEQFVEAAHVEGGGQQVRVQHKETKSRRGWGDTKFKEGRSDVRAAHDAVVYEARNEAAALQRVEVLFRVPVLLPRIAHEVRQEHSPPLPDLLPNVIHLPRAIGYEQL